jgi:Glutamine amidotransferases class-II
MRATFWLLEAPDSLAEQSRRNPDGYGLATFGENARPRIAKRPAEAYEDALFAREARQECSRTFVAHVRYASSGGLTIENTHRFEQEGRVFAHRGYIGDLEALDSRLGEHRELVRGDTSSSPRPPTSGRSATRRATGCGCSSGGRRAERRAPPRCGEPGRDRAGSIGLARHPGFGDLRQRADGRGRRVANARVRGARPRRRRPARQLPRGARRATGPAREARGSRSTRGRLVARGGAARLDVLARQWGR